MKTFVLLTLVMSLFLSACGSSKPRNQNVTAGNQATEVKRMTADQVSKVTNDWPIGSRDQLTALSRKYGQPSEATNSMVIWHNNGPWKRTTLYKNQGTNGLEQTATLMVPPEKLGELSMFNKNITVNQASNEVSARSDREETNFLAMNLAKEIADGNMTAMEARRQYSAVTDVTNNKNRYTEQLNFNSNSTTQGSNTNTTDDSGSL